jgi:HK97 family phage prohead protease
METKSLLMEVKADDAGAVEGYGSVFGNEDSYGDVILPGAFAASIARKKPKMLWQHRMEKPIGVWDEVIEDGTGLRMRGRVANTAQGMEARELVRMGALDGLSIGFQTVGHRMQGNQRQITEIDLWEVSFVTIPANDRAVITALKSMSDAPAVEQMLRDAFGYSRTEAKIFMARGYKGLLEHLREADGMEDPDTALREAEAVKASLKQLLERIGK